MHPQKGALYFYSKNTKENYMVSDSIQTLPLQSFENTITLGYFNPIHIIAMLIAPLFFMVIYNALKYKSIKTKENALYWISISNVVLFVIYKIALASASESFLVFEHLPLHLCNFNLFLIPLALKEKGTVLKNYLYFISIWGAYSGVLFFDTIFLEMNATSFSVVAYFVCHSVITVTPLLMAALGIFRPARYEIWRSLQVLFLLAVIMLCINVFLRRTGLFEEANYFYTMGMEGNPVLGRLKELIPIPLAYMFPLVPIIYGFDYLIAIPFDRRKELNYV